ncbi:lytic transglycosylase domain-containing protein [Salmonella enterica]|nr:lytic transglycosylase domain-containing protein [Salmonella enterica]
MADNMDFHVKARADFDEVKKMRQELENFKRTAESTGKVKLELPIVETLEDVVALRKEMEKIVKLSPSLGNILKKSGKQSFSQVNLGDVYASDSKAAETAQRVLGKLGAGIERIIANNNGKGGAGGAVSNPQTPWGAAGMNIMQSGFGASGSWGGAIGNGLAGFGGGATFGAGAIGMIGGLAALAVGKLVGAIAQKVGDAQQQQILTDRIIRMSGINDYTSKGWTRSLYSGATAANMKINDFTNLVAQFQQNGNFKGSPIDLAETVGHTAQFSQGFGMESGAAAQFFSRASGLNIARDQQAMQKLGLYLGEGIAKSGAFGQSQKFMEAVGDYMRTQSRVALNGGGANGFIGALSGMVSMNVPGLDVAGSASVLNAANTNIMRGGAHGEASQMFMARMATRNGMKNPFELRVLQEGGMFATANDMFGKDSEYAKHFAGGPGGDKTVFEMVRSQLGKNYKRGSKEYYLALANQFGIGINQAMALDRLNPNDIKQTTEALRASGVDLTQMNASAIPDLVKANTGGATGLKDVVGRMLGSSNPYKLSGEEQQQLRDVAKGGNATETKELVNKLLAEHGQAETEGSKTRDSLAKIDRTIQSFADKAVPALNVMMMAAANAGGGEAAIRRKYAEQLQKDRSEQIGEEYKGRRAEIQSKIDDITAKGGSMQNWGYTPLTELKGQMSELDSQELKERKQMQESVNQEAYGSRAGYLDASMKKDVKAINFDKDTIARMKSMDKDIVDAANAAGIDPDWFRAQIATESNFTNDRVSKSGAKGAGQLMPGNTKGIDPLNQRQNLFRSAKVYADFQNARPNASRAEVQRLYNGGWNPPNNKESLEYPFKVEANKEAIDSLKAQGVFDSSDVKVPNQAVGAQAPGTTNLRGEMDVHVHHPNGTKQTTTVPVFAKSYYRPPNQFEDRLRKDDYDYFKRKFAN